MYILYILNYYLLLLCKNSIAIFLYFELHKVELHNYTKQKMQIMLVMLKLSYIFISLQDTSH